MPELFKARITADCLRKNYRNDWFTIHEYIKVKLPDALIVQENLPKCHIHVVGLTTSITLQELRTYFRSRFTDRGFMVKFYTPDELTQRTPEYYYGYLMKMPNDSHILSPGSLTAEYLEQCALEYSTHKEDPAEGFRSFILRNKPKDYQAVYNLVILWYRHSKSDFKYDNIKKKYNRGCMYAFPDKFSSELQSLYDHASLLR